MLVHGRDAARIRAVVGRITSAGGQAVAIKGDLATDEGAAAVYSEAKTAFGGIDILINNAGAYEARSWFETTPATWRKFFETDVLSAVRLILAVVPDMRQAGWGRVINVATGMATTPQAVMADYAAAKAAMVNSTVSLAKALAGTGVTANTISPGVIHTEGVERVLREAAQRLAMGGRLGGDSTPLVGEPGGFCIKPSGRLHQWCEPTYRWWEVPIRELKRYWDASTNPRRAPTTRRSDDAALCCSA